MQDIFITPQPSSGEPSIVFTASGDVSPITLNVVSGIGPVSGVTAAGSGITSLSFEGTQGQLFSITDNLSSGTLFSVSDIAGLPFMEIDASGDVKLAQFGNTVTTYKPLLSAASAATLGTSNSRWPYLYADNGDFSDTVSSMGIVVSGHDLATSVPIINISGGSASAEQERIIFQNSNGLDGCRISTMGSHSQGMIIDVGYKDYSSYDFFKIRANAQDATPDDRFSINRQGNIQIGEDHDQDYNDSQVILSTRSASKSVLHVKGAASQSANMQEWQDSTGTVLASVTPDGSIASSGNISASGDISASGNIGIGTSSPLVKLDILGTPDSDYAPATVVSITGKTGSGTNWSGTNVETGYAHTAGSTDPLVTNITSAHTTKYIVIITTSGVSAGRVEKITFGNTTRTLYISDNRTSNYSFLTQLTNDGGTNALEIHPRSDFVGTISIDSVEQIGARDAVVNIRNSAGTIGNEIRTGASKSIYIGFEAGQSTNTTWNNNTNTAIGYRALKNNLQGGNNTVIGYNSMASAFMNSYVTAVGHSVFPSYKGNTSNAYNTGMGTSIGTDADFVGIANVLIGNNILTEATTANGNIAIGYAALRYLTTGDYNTALGYSALIKNTTGSYNVAISYDSLKEMTTGSHNIAMGRNSGRYYGESLSALTTTNNSIFIGRNTKASGDSQTNQIVIGYEAIGNGSNSVTLGNTSITKTILNGDVGIDTISPEAKLHAVATSATDVGVIVEGAASQSANLQEWQTGAGTVLASVAADGSIASSGSGSFSNDLSVETGGSFKLFALGDSHTNTTNTEYLETYYDTDRFYIRPKSTGTGVVRKTYLGDDRTFWQTDPATNSILARVNNQQVMYATTSEIKFFKDVKPNVTETNSLGGSVNRWANTYSVSGSFTGDLVVEPSGSFKLFNLGDSHTNTTNTEYLEIEGDASIGYYKIQPKYTGTGSSSQSLRLLAVQGSHISLYAGGQFAYTHAGVAHLYGNVDGVRISHLTVTGDASFAGSISGTRGFFESSTTTDTPLTITSAVSQTANLQEWRTSAGDVLTSIDNDGNVDISGTLRCNDIGITAGNLSVNTGNGSSVYFKVNNTLEYVMNAVDFRPNNLAKNLGTDTARWANTYTDVLTVGDGVDTVVANSSGITIDGQAPSTTPLLVKGAVSQSANVLEVKDSAGNTDFSVSHNGVVQTRKLNVDTSVTLVSNQYIEWGGSNNRVRGLSGGAGGGRIELITGANDGTGGKGIALVARGDGRGGKGAVIMGENRDTDYHLEVVGSGAMNGIYASGESTFVANTATQTPVLFQGAASQSANLTEWQNNAGENLAFVNQRGELNLNTAKVDSAREQLITAKISESDSAFGVTNLTSNNGLFLPAFYGYNNDDNRSALGFVGIMATAHDDSSTQNGVIDFNVCKIPNNSSDPMNESRDPITSKNLFTLRNNATKVLTITKSGFMQLIPTATGVALSIEVDSNRATESPIIELKRTSTSVADDDSLGQLKFVGENDADESVVYSTVTCRIGDKTDGSEDGYMETKVMKDGSLAAVASQTSSALQLLNGVGLESDGPITAGGSGIPYTEPVSGASGVVNMMVINSGTYAGITPDANTLYFIVDP